MPEECDRAPLDLLVAFGESEIDISERLIAKAHFWDRSSKLSRRHQPWGCRLELAGGAFLLTGCGVSHRLKFQNLARSIYLRLDRETRGLNPHKVFHMRIENVAGERTSRGIADKFEVKLFFAQHHGRSSVRRLVLMFMGCRVCMTRRLILACAPR